MVHYICTGGCKGVSDVAKTCDTAGCAHFGQPLAECNCADNKHHDAFEKHGDSEDLVVNNG